LTELDPELYLGALGQGEFFCFKERSPFGLLPFTVSRICLGTGSSGNRGPSQQAQQAEDLYSLLLIEAWRRGISFWDTADNYRTHPHVAKALKQVPRDQVQLTSKTYSRTASETRADVERCLAELETSYIDVLLLHEVDSCDEFEEKLPCLEELHRMKSEGLIRAVGVSTHSIDVLEKLVVHPLVEVVFTNYNVANQHMDASMRDYEAALQTAFDSGKAVYLHKTLNEGKLMGRYEEAIAFNLSRPFAHSVAVGIVKPQELDRLLRCVGRPESSSSLEAVE
jgi:aryl-alcohol dehydrogenase-like predicted oxidoreductase